MGTGSSRKKHSCFTNLPDEHLYLIFEKLDSNLDQESFGLTCHRFLDIQSSSLKHLELQHLPWLGNLHTRRVEIDSLILDKLLNRFRQLESLSLSGCVHVTDSGLVLLQKYGVKLRSLYLDFCDRITNVGFSYIASGCPSLLVIDLSRSSIDDNGLEIVTKSCNSLEEVSLEFFDEVTDCGIRSLTMNCRRLRALRITGCKQVNGFGFKGCSSTLACLEADGCGHFNGLAEVVSGGRIKYLNLGTSWPKNFKRDGLTAISSGLAANLKILNIWGNCFVNDDAIKSISKGCPLLQEWSLEFCGNVTISGWESIGLHCQSLERIHVSRCFKLCDSGLLALGSGCKRLSVIYMRDCPLITQFGIELFKIQSANVEIKTEEVLLSILPIWAFKVTPPYRKIK